MAPKLLRGIILDQKIGISMPTVMGRLLPEESL